MNAFTRTGKGVRRIAGGLKPLVWPGEWREAVARWFVLAVVGSLLLTSMALHTWLLYGLLGGLLVAAYRLGGDAARTEATDGEIAAQAPEDAASWKFHPDDTLDLVWELIGDRNGVLLSQIREQLQTETSHAWTPQDVRALLADAGIPVRDGVRVRGVGNSTGVHRADVPPLPSPAPSGASVGGVGGVVTWDDGSNANTNNTASLRLLPDGGAVISIPDADNPHRTHVQMIPTQRVSKS